MKVRLLALVAFLLSVVSAMAQQRFSSLPIGANLDGYISSIQIWYGPLGSTINGEFPYNRRQDGSLESFAISKLREMSNRFVPKTGQETALYGYGISALTDGIGGLLPTYNGENKPATIAVAPVDGENGFHPILRNGKWEVPEEVFGKVKFQFGAAPGFYIPGIANLEVNLYNGSRISRFSTRERVSDSDNPCVLPAALDAIKYEEVMILPNEIALAKPSWWERAEITLYTKTESVTFLVNRTPDDGKAIRWSNPPPSFFVPPPPKITLLKRSNNATELTIEGIQNTKVTLEWAEALEKKWWPLFPTPISLGVKGRIVFVHGTQRTIGFYRVYAAGQSPQ